MKKAEQWGFDPKFFPSQEVWWVDERLHKGEIIGIAFENVLVEKLPYSIPRMNIVYFILERSGETEKTHEISQLRLFDSKESAIVYIEKVSP